MGCDLKKLWMQFDLESLKTSSNKYLEKITYFWARDLKKTLFWSSKNDKTPSIFSVFHAND